MKLKEQLAALVAKMNAVLDGAKASGRDLNADEVAQLKTWTEEADGLKAQIELQADGEALAKSVAALSAKGAEAPADQPGGDDKPARTLGAHVVKHAGANIKSSRGERSFTVSAPEFKAAGDVQVTPESMAPVLTQYDTTIVEAPRRRLTVEDLLGAETISGNALTYFIEGALEGAPEFVLENGKKPQIHFNDPTPKTEALAKIAAYIKESDELLEDLPRLASSIDGRLLYQLNLMIEDQLLNGTGAANGLLGLLNRSGLQTETAGDAKDNPDALFRAMTKVQNGSGFAADGLVINPADYQALRLMKDANEQYFGGGFFAGQYGQGGIIEQPPVWGLRTVVTPAIAPGTALVGAYKQSASVLSKGGVRVDITNSNEDDFIHNRITELAERRLALAARRPAGFAKVTFAAAAGGGE